jgi:hypothetical protein
MRSRRDSQHLGERTEDAFIMRNYPQINDEEVRIRG